MSAFLSDPVETLTVQCFFFQHLFIIVNKAWKDVHITMEHGNHKAAMKHSFLSSIVSVITNKRSTLVVLVSSCMKTLKNLYS